MLKFETNNKQNESLAVRDKNKQMANPPRKPRCWQKCLLQQGFSFKFFKLIVMVIFDIVAPLSDFLQTNKQ